MKFESIVGQHEAKARLIKSVTEQRVPHALLITGPEGTGKLALAIAFAQYIACQNRTQTDSCGECPSCRKIQKLVHPDLHFVYPVNTGGGDDEKAAKVSDTYIEQWRESLLENPYLSEPQWYSAIAIENKQGIISTAEGSEIIRKLSLKSFESEYKFMVIWLPERMNHFAANKLLKLVEEPPEKTLFLMVSEDPERLLKTIASRTQLVMVPPIARHDIATHLVEKFELPPEKAHDIARVANGNFNEVQKLMGTDKQSPYFEMFQRIMRICYLRNVPDALDWAEDAASLGRERQKELLAYMVRMIRESLMLNLGIDEIVYLAGDEADFGKKFSPFINGHNVVQFYNELGTAIEHISRNGNGSIVFTHLALTLMKLIVKK